MRALLMAALAAALVSGRSQGVGGEACTPEDLLAQDPLARSVEGKLAGRVRPRQRLLTQRRRLPTLALRPRPPSQRQGSVY